jgi:transcriptional regulator with XRE-family HTH domain
MAMNFEAMSDKALLAEIGRRVQVRRLNMNITQADVAEKAGISRRALQNLESGRVCTLPLLIRTLRALGNLDALDNFLPEPGPSPLQLAKLKGRERQRAGRRRRTDDKPGD